MNRPSCLFALALAWLAFASCAPSGSSADGTTVVTDPTGEAPEFGSSVILIVLDDIGTDRLSFYVPELDPTAIEPPCGPDAEPGTKPYPCTPMLARLRSRGVLFTQAYTNPSCSPTRASILTGRYAHRHGIGRIVNEGLGCGPELDCDGPDSLADEEVLLPEMLRGAARSAGWEVATGAFGKYQLTYVVGDECHPIENGFEVFQGNMGNSGRNLVGPDHFEWVYTDVREGAAGEGCVIERSERIAPAFGCEEAAASWDATVTRRAARRWIESQIEQERRFFAYVAFNPPHRVVQVPPLCRVSSETRARLAELGLDETGRVLECELTPCNDEELIAVYNATVEAVDREIELLLEGLPPDVTVLVIGDNGTPVDVVDAEPSEFPPCRTKGSLFQLGVRVPLLVAGDAVPEEHRGGTCTRFVESVDLWRTVSGVVGLTDAEVDAWMTREVPGRAIDSRSFLPLVDNPWGPGDRTFVYSERFGPNQGNGDGEGDFEPTRWDVMVSDGTYKLIRRMDELEWQDGVPIVGALSEQLFKLTNDPQEENPLCAPVPLDCDEACPSPACAALEYPDCGSPDCSDPAGCCPPPCPVPVGSPFLEPYLELRARLDEVSGIR